MATSTEKVDPTAHALAKVSPNTALRDLIVSVKELHRVAEISTTGDIKIRTGIPLSAFCVEKPIEDARGALKAAKVGYSSAMADRAVQITAQALPGEIPSTRYRNLRENINLLLDQHSPGSPELNRTLSLILSTAVKSAITTLHTIHLLRERNIIHGPFDENDGLATGDHEWLLQGNITEIMAQVQIQHIEHAGMELTEDFSQQSETAWAQVASSGMAANMEDSWQIALSVNEIIKTAAKATKLDAASPEILNFVALPMARLQGMVLAKLLSERKSSTIRYIREPKLLINPGERAQYMPYIG